MAVSGNYAYVANLDAPDAGLQVIDVSNPANPVRIGNYSIAHGATRLALSGNYVYLAGANTGLHVIDVGNPANPVRVGGTNNTLVRDVAVLGNYAYAACGSAGLLVFNVSNPTNWMVVGTNKSGNATGVALSGNFAYRANDCSRYSQVAKRWN